MIPEAEAMEAMEALSLSLSGDLTTLTTPLKLYAGKLALLGPALSF